MRTQLAYPTSLLLASGVESTTARHEASCHASVLIWIACPQVCAVAKERRRCAVPAVAGTELNKMVATTGVDGPAGEHHARRTGGGAAAGREQADSTDGLHLGMRRAGVADDMSAVILTCVEHHATAGRQCASRRCVVDSKPQLDRYRVNSCCLRSGHLPSNVNAARR